MCVHYVIPYIMLFKLVFGFNLLFAAQYVNDLMALFVQVCYLASVRIVAIMPNAMSTLLNALQRCKGSDYIDFFANSFNCSSRRKYTCSNGCDTYWTSGVCHHNGT